MQHNPLLLPDVAKTTASGSQCFSSVRPSVLPESFGDVADLALERAAQAPDDRCPAPLVGRGVYLIGDFDEQLRQVIVPVEAADTGKAPTGVQRSGKASERQ